MEAARPLIEAKRYAEAKDTLEPLAASPEASFDLLVKVAGVYDGLAIEVAADKQEGAAAREEARKAYDAYGKKAVEYYLRAGGLSVKSRDPRVESVFRRVLGYQPRQPDALRSLGALSRDPRWSMYYYKEYVTTERGQRDYDAQLNLADILIKQGGWRQAIEVLLKMREVGGLSAERLLAQAYIDGNQMDKALSILEKALQREPNDVKSHLLRASLTMKQKGLPSINEVMNEARIALDLSTTAVKNRPENDAEWGVLSETASNVGTIIQKLRPEILAGKLDDQTVVAFAGIMTDLANTSNLNSKYNRVVMLTQAGAADKAGVTLLTALAEAQAEIGRLESAAATAERILKLDPNNSTARQIMEKRPAAGAKP